MLRRRLFVVLLCLVAGGLPLAANAMSAAMQADHSCMQQEDGLAADCSGGMAAGTCSMHCAAGACVVSALCSATLAAPSAKPFGSERAVTPACRSAPDPAPPRPSLS